MIDKNKNKNKKKKKNKSKSKSKSNYPSTMIIDKTFFNALVP